MKGFHMSKGGGCGVHLKACLITQTQELQK